MKEKLNVKNRSALLSVIGLAFLLLLSPCKVKNFIQAELGVSKTEVLNESKTTIGNCNITELSKVALSFSNSTTQHLSAIATSTSDLNFNTVDFNNQPSISFDRRNHQPSLTPYYILYQNFKVYHL